MGRGRGRREIFHRASPNNLGFKSCHDNIIREKLDRSQWHWHVSGVYVLFRIMKVGSEPAVGPWSRATGGTLAFRFAPCDTCRNFLNPCGVLFS